MPAEQKHVSKQFRGMFKLRRFFRRFRFQLTSKSLALRSSDVRESDVALVHGLAVTAAAVELAEVVNSEAGDLERAGAVVLQDLVLGAESAAAGDGGGLAGLLLLNGESVLADSGPPDVGQLAGAHAVDTLNLVGTDDDVGERGAGLVGC